MKTNSTNEKDGKMLRLPGGRVKITQFQAVQHTRIGTDCKAIYDRISFFIYSNSIHAGPQLHVHRPNNPNSKQMFIIVPITTDIELFSHIIISLF